LGRGRKQHGSGAPRKKPTGKGQKDNEAGGQTGPKKKPMKKEENLLPTRFKVLLGSLGGRGKKLGGTKKRQRLEQIRCVAGKKKGRGRDAHRSTIKEGKN